MSVAVYRSLDEARGRFGPCALTIGNFDGVHLGHQALIRAACEYAQKRNLTPAVLTFDPHPATFVAPERVPELICNLEDRIRLLAEAGARRILVLPFNRELARLAPAEFVDRTLVRGLEMRAVIVGENFRFGHRQAGTTETLLALGETYGFGTQFLSPVSYRGCIVSSSAIRKRIEEVRVESAGRLLGRCFFIRGPVVTGAGIGSRQTVPTLNLAPPKGQILPRGVFVTETIDLQNGRRWPSITNVGTRPTFDGQGVTVETFLLAPLKDAPPTEIEVRFRRFLRREEQFADAGALKQQILRDVSRANAYWRRAPK